VLLSSKETSSTRDGHSRKKSQLRLTADRSSGSHCHTFSSSCQAVSRPPILPK
jgi:hypothetical protein